MYHNGEKVYVTARCSDAGENNGLNIFYFHLAQYNVISFAFSLYTFVTITVSVPNASQN